MIDLHIHTTYSDGQAAIPEVFKVASQKNLDCFAISDHFTTTSKQYIIPTLNLDNIDKYIIEIRDNIKSHSIKCFLGIEIDWESDFGAIEELPLEEFDLINFEDVHSINSLNKICKLIDDRNLKAVFCLAHPNIHMYDGYYPANLNFVKRQLAPLLLQYNIAFELNSRYTHRWLNLKPRIQALIQEGVIFSIGSDAHFTSDIGEVAKQYEFLDKMGGINNIIRIC
ncbi:MAG: PHP domain-containing protein [Candidatus Helarchaeota archaeon]